MSKTRIMVVEDEAITALCLRDSLDSLGYETLATVARGEEAVHMALELRPDLILMDITLAGNLGGIQAAEQIRKVQQIPVVFMTAHSDSETLAEAKKAEPFGYLTKPYKLDNLKNTIEIALYKSAADARVRESEKHYRLLFESMSSAFALHEMICNGLGKPCDFKFLEVNPAFEVSTGLTAEAVIGRTYRELFPDAEGDLVEIYGRVALNGESICFERYSPELQRHFDIQAYSPERGRFATIIADVTEIKRREEMTLLVARGVSSQVGEGFFRSLTKNLIQALDADHAFVGELIGDEVSVIAGELRGKEISTMRYSLKGTPCAEALSATEVCIYAEGVQGLFPEDIELQKIGVEGYVGTPLVNAEGKTIGIVVVLFSQKIRNPRMVVSILKIFAARAAAELERKKTETILLESEARYKNLSQEFETIVNGIPDAITLWSPEMRLLWANKGALEQFNADLPSVAGRDCLEICQSCDNKPHDCEIRRCFRSRAIENRLRNDSGGRSWGVKAFPLIDEDGRVFQVIRVASDITERMHLREEAARSAHLAALGELAAGVAHEVNNPTGLILLEMPILRDVFHDARPILEEYYAQHGDFSFAGMKYSEMRDQVGPMIDEITEGAQRIKRIVSELKDFSRPVEKIPFVPVDLNEVVRKAGSLVAGRIKKLTDNFVVEYAPQPVMVLGNFQKLEQVIINLVINACQSLADRSSKVEVAITALTSRDYGVVTIRDEGRGIPSDHLPLITDPFFTTRRESGGTGLGLSVSLRIVEEHLGTMRFDSAPSKGTSVTLEIPMAFENL